MLQRVLRWLRRKEQPTKTDAYNLGRLAAASITEDVEDIVDALLRDRRQNFIAVLSGRLEGVKDVEGVSYAKQAQIEYKVMLENWSKHIPDQKDEAWHIVRERWPAELVMTAPDELRELINARVEAHYTQLFSEGLEHAADAVTIRNGSAGGA